MYHEVFAESRRSSAFVPYRELRALDEALSDFCSAVLDEPYLEPEEPIHRHRSYSITDMLRKK